MHAEVKASISRCQERFEAVGRGRERCGLDCHAGEYTSALPHALNWSKENIGTELCRNCAGVRSEVAHLARNETVGDTIRRGHGSRSSSSI
jgi:hypothetical protein